LHSARLQAGILAAAAGLIVLVFRLGGGDAFLSHLFFDPARAGFWLKNNWLLAVPGHTGLKWTMLGVWALCLVLGGQLRRGGLYMGAIAVVVLLIREISPYSCPWDLPEFGGDKPQAGRCAPAAHPLTGFALFGLYLALREGRRRGAYAALAAAWVIGIAAGAIQLARGAHFASHVLWTAWVAWALTLVLARLPPAARGRPRA
jgi:membrane-associated PAP2 superfamily phosphatase